MLDLWDFEWTQHLQPPTLHFSESLDTNTPHIEYVTLEFKIKSTTVVNYKVERCTHSLETGLSCKVLKDFYICSTNSRQLARRISYIIHSVENYFNINFGVHHNLPQIAATRDCLLEEILLAVEKDTTLTPVIYQEALKVLTILRKSKHSTPKRLYGLRTALDTAYLVVLKAPTLASIICKACNNVNLFNTPLEKIINNVLKEIKNYNGLCSNNLK